MLATQAEAGERQIQGLLDHKIKAQSRQLDETLSQIKHKVQKDLGCSSVINDCPAQFLVLKKEKKKVLRGLERWHSS